MSKVYAIVQERIVKELKQAIETGSCTPWIYSNVLMNYISENKYRGINRMLLPQEGYCGFVYHNVFHISNVEGIEPKIKVERFNHDINETAEPIIETFCKKYDVKFHIVKGGSRAYYTMDKNVYVPDKSQFENLSAYYSTQF